MFIIPQPHKCTKCGHEQPFSPDTGAYLRIIDREPFCPVCMSEFLKKNVGLLKCTVDWDGKGSEYETAKKGPAT